MQFFLDIDGVLLDFERAFARWLNERYGFSLPADYETPSWNFDNLLTREQIKEAWHSFLESEYSASMPSLVEQNRFNALARVHAIHLLTNFPQQFADKRLRNLAGMGFTYASLHYCGLHGYRGVKPRSKSELIAELRAEGEPSLFMDDHPENCLDVLQNCPEVEVWLMSRRFNREFAHPAIRRAQSWQCVFDRVGELSGVSY